MKYAKFSDDFLSDFRLDDNGETLVLTDKRGYTRAVKLLPYEERAQGDLISREALKEGFKGRLALCNEWIEKAKDKETKIRASAVKTFIADVLITINNTPTVEITENQAILHLLKCGWLVNNEAEWKIKGNKIECSKCEKCVFVGTNDIGVLNEEMLLFKFCPNCGAKMKDGAE